MEVFDIVKFLMIAAVFAPLERLLPRRRAQRTLRRLWSVDLMHAVFTGFLIRIGGAGFVVLAAALGESTMPTAWRDHIQALPLPVQFVLIMIIADLGFYAMHRAFHHYPLLWRIHSIHHSIEEMDWLAAHRVHPIDQILTRMMTLAPVFYLGFSSDAMIAFLFLYEWQSFLIHSNVKVNFGLLRWLLASPEFHHWHHANEDEAHDKNFAGQLPLIDALFGTAYMPKHRQPERYGVDQEIPASYSGQLAFPFRQHPGQQQEDALRSAQPIS